MRTLLLSLLIGCAAPTVTPTTPPGTIRHVEVGQLLVDLQAGTPSLLIDVRSRADYDQGHIPQATNLEASAVAPLRTKLAIPPGGELYLVDHTGELAERTAHELADLGVNTVFVTGGTTAWIAAGHPIERLDPANPDTQ